MTEHRESENEMRKEAADEAVQQLIQVAMSNPTNANGNVGRVAETAILVIQTLRKRVDELEQRLTPKLVP